MNINEVVKAHPNRNLSIADFARFSKVSMFCHDGKRWHGQILIGAGAATIEIDHWGASPEEVWSTINDKFWSMVNDLVPA